MKSADKMAIVVQEILQDKIYLDHAGNVQTLGGNDDPARRAMMTDISDAGGSSDD
jgi:hypothetical protein